MLIARGYHGSMSLFSSSIAASLVNLKELVILNCTEMVKVIEDDEEKEKVVSGSQRTLLFPKLQTLYLNQLCKLESFCEWKCDVEFPSLRELQIFYCNNMKTCTLGPLATPNLESVRIDDGDFGAVKDLNGVLRQHYLIFARAKVRTTNILNEYIVSHVNCCSRAAPRMNLPPELIENQLFWFYYFIFTLM